MTAIGRPLLFLALPMALLPPPAHAQNRCEAELQQLETDVQEAELNEQERAKYRQLMEGATAQRDAGEVTDCLATIENIRRVIRPDECRVGEECLSTCIFRWSP